MPISLETISGFENLQRMARMFVTVPFVPDTFRAPYTDEKGKRRGCSSIEEAIGCCVVALDMAMRMKANPLAVMQNIYVVHGRPAWTAQFLLATLNNSGRFSTIRYKFQGTQGNDDWGCRAVAKELTTGEIVEGPLITIGLAKHEGWFKNSSKWQSMPDLMLRYRAVSWFVRAHAPEIAMGLKTEDELRDTIELIPQEDGSWAKPVEEATPSTSVETIRESASPADRGQKMPHPIPAHRTRQRPEERRSRSLRTCAMRLLRPGRTRASHWRPPASWLVADSPKPGARPTASASSRKPSRGHLPYRRNSRKHCSPRNPLPLTPRRPVAPTQRRNRPRCRASSRRTRRSPALTTEPRSRKMTATTASTAQAARHTMTPRQRMRDSQPSILPQAPRRGPRTRQPREIHATYLQHHHLPSVRANIPSTIATLPYLFWLPAPKGATAQACATSPSQGTAHRKSSQTSG